MAQIVLGGGCFWCIEAALKDIRGVEAVVNGYAGGSVPGPSYEQVCTGRTGHAEVVRVTFDEDELPLATLLEIFFSVHDPTTRDRQGADVGTQYRSIILTTDPRQETIVQAAIQSAQTQWEKPTVTEVRPLEAFYEAEAYHQDYYARNPDQGYCRVVISPKLAKLRAKWAHRLAQA